MVVAGRERWWLRFAYPPYILASLRLCEKMAVPSVCFVCSVVQSLLRGLPLHIALILWCGFYLRRNAWAGAAHPTSLRLCGRNGCSFRLLRVFNLFKTLVEWIVGASPS